MTDIEAMQLALDQARISFERGEVPVGAVLLLDGELIASAHNEVEALQDASAHAEMLCLRRSTQKLKSWRLLGATLYCTLEPCTMCAGAMILHRLKRVVWGAPDVRQGAHGSWVDLHKANHPIHTLEVERGILAEESAQLLKSFFQMRREECVSSKNYLMR
jgi:tRNA(adenine34) deaminase